MEVLQQLAGAGDVPALASFCENFELDLRHNEEPTATSILVYKLQLLCYLLCERLDSARFLWKRLPIEFRDEELCSLWEVGVQMWQHNPAGVQAALAAFDWSGPFVAPLVERLRHEQLERSFRLLGRTYGSMSSHWLANTLGIAEEKVHLMAGEAGWTLDSDTSSYTPLPEPEAKRSAMGMEQLQQLVDYVAHVERELV